MGKQEIKQRETQVATGNGVGKQFRDRLNIVDEVIVCLLLKN